MPFTIYPIVFQQRPGVSELLLIGTAIGAIIAGAVVFANTARERKKARSVLVITATCPNYATAWDSNTTRLAVFPIDA
jgi:hypothetical protein